MSRRGNGSLQFPPGGAFAGPAMQAIPQQQPVFNVGPLMNDTQLLAFTAAQLYASQPGTMFEKAHSAVDAARLIILQAIEQTPLLMQQAAEGHAKRMKESQESVS